MAKMCVVPELKSLAIPVYAVLIIILKSNVLPEMVTLTGTILVTSISLISIAYIYR